MKFSWEFTNGLELGQLEYRGEIDLELISAMFRRGTHDGNFIGCYRATLPLECLTDEGEKLFRKLKPYSVEQSIIRAIISTGVPALSFNVIIGRPEDDERALATTYQRCLEISDLGESSAQSPIIYYNVYVLSLLPGTVDYRRYRSMLAFDLNKDPEVVTFYLGSLNTPHFSPFEITQARGTMASLLNNAALVRQQDETNFITSPRFRRLFTGN
jgi:hypothetical protein